MGEVVFTLHLLRYYVSKYEVIIYTIIIYYTFTYIHVHVSCLVFTCAYMYIVFTHTCLYMYHVSVHMYCTILYLVHMYVYLVSSIHMYMYFMLLILSSQLRWLFLKTL